MLALFPAVRPLKSNEAGSEFAVNYGNGLVTDWRSEMDDVQRSEQISGIPYVAANRSDTDI